jgi:DNA-binding transcriptional LysR family regulator
MALAPAGGALAGRESLGWAELSALPLALLTPDMQNRRLISQHMAEAGAEADPVLEANSVITLVTHVIEGGLATVLPSRLAELFGRMGGLDAVPLVAPEAEHLIGLVAPERDPATPAVAALMREAQRLAEAEV